MMVIVDEDITPNWYIVMSLNDSLGSRSTPRKHLDGTRL